MSKQLKSHYFSLFLKKIGLTNPTVNVCARFQE